MTIHPTRYFTPSSYKRFALIILSLLLQLLLAAQERRDTVRTLSNDLDTTIIAEPPPPIEEAAEEETDDDTATDKTEKADEKEKEYFLPIDPLSGGDTLHLRTISDNRKEALKKDKAFWYANQAFKKMEKKLNTSEPLTSHPAFQTILWLIIIGGFAACVILYLSNSSIGVFRKNRTIAGAEPEEETDDIFAINYQREIDKATGIGNFRLAIRLMFLRELKQLSDRNIIQYTQDRTNFDYLSQMRSSAMYADFFKLTRNYEYSWYGQFDIDAEKFALIRKEFDHFDRKLN